MGPPQPTPPPDGESREWMRALRAGGAKFAVLHAATRLRRRAWQGRELPLPPEAWDRLAAAERRAATPAGGPRGARPDRPGSAP